MDTNTEKNQVFGDYASFLHALLPQAQAFMFHDRHARLFWHDNSPDTSQLSDEFHKTLKRILKQGDLPGDMARLPLRDCVAYLVRLDTDAGRALGVLTVLVDREVGTMSHKFCSDLLKPARRSMERELSLRVHLLDANRQISTQDSEYDYLRCIGETSRSKALCGEALSEILDKTVNQLSLDAASFYSPAHSLEICVGVSPANRTQLELMYEALLDRVRDAGGDAISALQAGPGHNDSEQNRSWPVFEDGGELTGILVLSRAGGGWKDDTRAASIAGFVASTVEHLLERSFDPVTGLMTWPGFEQALADAGKDEGKEHSVLYLDMDQLHLLNDTLGREAGDQALRELGTIVRQILNGHLTTRVTSDSFAALLLNTDPDSACQLGMQICEELQSLEYTSEGQSFRPSASIGIAPLDRRETGAASSLLVPAQVACQAAKDRGRNRVELYEDADKSIMKRMDDLNQVGSIRSAIEGGRLVLFAQPIEQASGQQDVSYHELLVRMLDSAGEPVPPSEFMGAAERYQLMQDLDRWVVNKAIETLSEELHDSCGRPIRFAINLSGQSIGSEKFLDFLTHKIIHSGVDPSRLCLEITETVAVGNLKKAQHFIEELRGMGCQFSLDDFGTGLSSFAYLKMFSVDKLKIDGSFVADMCENQVSRSMVSAIAEIARVMGIETVAEYVQSEDILNAIREIGVDWAQGFHVGEPQRLSDLFKNSTIVDKADLADVDAALLEQLPA